MRSREPNPGANAQISLVVHTLNEEAHLPGCLASAAAIVDQMVVVDMESEDRSREIARAFGAEVYSHPRVPLVDFARDYGLSLCRGDWILMLDADERLPPTLALWIENFVRDSPPASVRAVAFKCRHWFFGDWLRGGSWWQGYFVRLFRRGEGAWGRSIHAQPVVGEGVHYLEPRVELAIHHLAFPQLNDFIDRYLHVYTDVETELRRHRPLSPPRLLLLVVRRVLVELLWKRGYRDGTRGFMAASLYAMYEFLNKAKAWELEHNRHIPDAIEDGSFEGQR